MPRHDRYTKYIYYLINIIRFSVVSPACPTGYIWHITDLHYDPTYWTSQESCNSAVPKDELGQFGHVECDSPWTLVESAVNAMARAEHPPDIIFWTGYNN